LEKLATEMQGTWVLAKVNVDNNQRLAAQFGVQGIPAVKAFRNGKVVDQFTGALPESQIRTWLKKLVPSDVDQLADAALHLEADDLQAAVGKYRQALQADPKHGRSLLGLARALTLLNDPQATDVLSQISAGTPEYPAAQALRQIGTLMSAAQDDVAGARERLSLDPKNTQARWHLAATLARSQQWDDALRHLLAIVQQDRAFGNDAARQAMLAIFALLGERNPVAANYRRQLASALF
jgi:putative thioredoxin